MSRYVVGTDSGELATDLYEGVILVFTDLKPALLEADSQNSSFNGFYPGPDGKLIMAKPWKVYELVEIGNELGPFELKEVT